MKLLGFEDILDRAIEKYEVEMPYDLDERQKYRDTAIKKLRKIAKTNPSEGEDSFFGRATSNGKKTSPRYFTRSAADQIIMLAEDYFSKNSSNPHIRGLSQYRAAKEKAAAKKEELKKQPTREQLEAEYEEDQKRIGDAIRAAYEYETGRKPEDAIEYVDPETGESFNDFTDFANRYAQSFETDYFYEKDAGGIEPDYLEYDDPVPASREDIEKFIKDRRYGAIRKGYAFEPHRPKVITGIFERPMPDPAPRAREMKEQLLFDALFNHFYTPIDLDALKEDLFVTEDPEETHHDSMYFLCRERLLDYSNYTNKKAAQADIIKQQLDDISNQITARIGRLEKELSHLSEKPSNKSDAIKAQNTAGNDELAKKVDSLERKVNSLAFLCYDLKDSIKDLIERLDRSPDDAD